MSIKIYDGMKAVNSDPFTVAARFRSAVEPVFQRRFKDVFDTASQNIGKNWDEAFPGLLPLFPQRKAEKWLQPIPASSWSRADLLYDLIEDLRATPTHTFSGLDFGYEALLIPNGAPEGEPLLLLYSGSAEPYTLALKKHNATVAKPYGYWDNTDRPSGVSSAKWDERKLAWSPILGDKTPGEVGLLISQPSKFAVTLAARL